MKSDCRQGLDFKPVLRTMEEAKRQRRENATCGMGVSKDGKKIDLLKMKDWRSDVLRYPASYQHEDIEVA